MRILWQALRAATIETLGVAFVVVLVFGLPTWSLHQAANPDTPADAVWIWLESFPQALQRQFATIRPDTGREQYVEQRLSYYGQLYGDAAGEHLRGLADGISAERPAFNASMATGGRSWLEAM